jgi:hypothetical protein
VFKSSSAFNGHLHEWDVAKVTTMQSSKSIRILVVIDFMYRDVMPLCDWGLVMPLCDWGLSRGFGFVVMMWCKDGREVALKKAGD